MFQSLCPRGLPARRLLAAGLLIGLSGTSAFGAPPKPEDLVYASLDAQLKTYGVYVQQRLTSPYGVLRLKFVNDPAKGVSAEVVYPIIPAGIISYDSKSTLKTYYPRDNVVKVQTSPMRFRPNSQDRLRLITRNYRLKLVSETARVADRPVYIIEFTPKYAEVGSRLLYIDKEKKVPLKHVLIAEGDQPRVLVDTLNVSFTKGRNDPPLDFRVPDSADTETVWGPQRFTDAKAVAKQIGFAPSLPSRLPYGFVIEDKHLLGRKEKPFVGVRVSDGMWSMTVYEWSTKAFEGRPPDNLKVMEFDPIGVSYAIESDAPTDLGREILKYFVLR